LILRLFPHLAVVGIHRLLFGLVDLFTLFNLVRWLLLVTFPLTVLWSLRRMGFSFAQSALAGAAASLLSTPFLYGFDYGSYIWRGFGMYTQLWAMHLAFIGLVAVHTVIVRGRGHLLAIVALSMLVLSHLNPPPPNRFAERPFVRGVAEVRPTGWILGDDGLLIELPADSDKVTTRHW